MIAATPRLSQREPPSESWRQALADAITDPAELCSALGLAESFITPAIAAAHGFPLRVPRGFVRRMRRGDPTDPLLLQVLPLAAELINRANYVADPVGDLASRAGQGVLHKYHGSALLIATGACAVHCRYCFRRHFPYAEDSALAQGWTSALEAIRQDASITEVILSGGDPLSLSDRRLEQLTDALRSIEHVRRLRIHSRYPIVLPERVDQGFLGWLASVKLPVVMVIHANHAQEIDASVMRACAMLQGAGVTLLNQSVLLAGVNDSLEALAQLSEALFSMRILPYYLHVLDKVQGAAHFDLDEERAIELHAQLTARLPGYLVPRLVREIPGEPAKSPVRRRETRC